MGLLSFHTLPVAACLFLALILTACKPPPVENVYRKESRYPGGLNVPVAYLTSEWGGEPRVMASGWLIEGSNGVLSSAKHFSDVFIRSLIELGGGECKSFIASKVYDCIIVQVPPLRDAVILKLLGSLNMAELPKPYKIFMGKLRVGDKLFIQGFHPHPTEITKSNRKDGVIDQVIPILKNFYEVRMADPLEQKEIVFDSLEAKVVDLNFRARVYGEDNSRLGNLRFETNTFIKVITVRNHKFSFGGLSGGVAIKLNEKGEPEAVGIVTAERPVRFEYDKKGQVVDRSVKMAVFDTIMITPITSVKELYEYARQISD